MKRKFGFSEKECRGLSKLNTPRKIQDYLDRLAYNLEGKGETFYSPRMVMRQKKANCIEAAVFAAAALRFHGYPPLIVDLTSAARDDDHELAVFRHNGFWGAIGKSKYTFFAFREPVYRTIRELALSYFELYFNYWGEKTMRGFSQPVNLSRFDKKGWMTSEANLFYIVKYLEKIPHEKLITRGMARSLRKIPPLDKEAGELWIRRKRLLKKLKRKGYS